MGCIADKRNLYMLKGPLARKGYDWWWHSFTGYHHATGKPKAFFVEYFVINPSLSPSKVIYGQLKENKEKGLKPSYVMIKAGCWGRDARQIHGFYPACELTVDKGILNISIGQCKLSEHRLVGQVEVTAQQAAEHREYMCDSGKMSWDLEVNKKVAFNVGYGASWFFRKLNCFEMFWHAAGMKSEYKGTVMLDGEQYDIIPEKSFGYADKNWGGNYTSPWLWISSCNMTSLLTGKQLTNSVIDAGGGRPKVCGIPLNRKLLIAMYYEGQMYEYNFSKFWTGTRISFNAEEEKDKIVWTVNAVNNNSEMELTCSCSRDEMLLVNYEAPDGSKLHNRLWNGGTGSGEIKLYKGRGESRTLIDHISMQNVGCEYGEYSRGI